MATVRLLFFAAARDAASAASTTIDAATLGEALAQARSMYGPHFVAVLDHARVWVNGDEATGGDATVLVDDDEIAVLPPVSGG